MGATLNPEFNPLKEMVENQKPMVDTHSVHLGEPLVLMTLAEKLDQRETLTQLLDYKVKRVSNTLPGENKKEVEIILDQVPREGEIVPLCQRWHNLYFEDAPVQIENMDVKKIHRRADGKCVLTLHFTESPYKGES